MMYQGLNKRPDPGQAQARPDRPVFHTRRMQVAAKKQGGWLDAMLGKGSSQVLSGSSGRPRREAAVRDPVAAPWRAQAQAQAQARPATTLSMRALRSNDDMLAAPVGRKGAIRILALCVVGTALLVTLKPWDRLPQMAWPKMRLPAFAAGRQQKAVVQEPTPVPTPETVKKPVLPLADAKGSAVAFWRTENGQWYGVNGSAQLFKVDEGQVRSKLDLPRISGARVTDVESGSVRYLALDLKEGLLKELLPLSDEIAAEVASIALDGSEVRLLTHSGVTVRLGDTDFKVRQARLARVLYHLNAKKQRAASVDLRFEDSAQVKLASH